MVTGFVIINTQVNK